MKKLVVSSVFVAAILLTSVSATQARNINNRVSQANINQYCADKVAGREYRVSITTRSGATITGEILCGPASGTIVDRDSRNGNDNDRNDRNDRNGHDNDRNDRDHDDDRNDRDHDDDRNDRDHDDDRNDRDHDDDRNDRDHDDDRNDRDHDDD